METFRLDILNPKVKSLLKDLADLNLIRIKKDNTKFELIRLLVRLRINSDYALSP